MAQYETLPKSAKGKPTKFDVSVPEEKLEQFKQLIKLSPIGPQTYENLHEDRELGSSFGVTHKWLSNAKEAWLSFDWRAREEHINSFPHYKLPIKDDDGSTYDIHFVALFSEKPDAVPIALFHGWPGSFLEFLPMLSLIKKRFSPSELPYHLIVPSLPGYAFSSQPPLDKNFRGEDAARIMNKLMIQLGFESGYIAQGGDIGSFIARILAARYESCKVNFVVLFDKPEGVSDNAINEAEKKALARGQAFRDIGAAYAMEHGTRPATIGLVLSSSPIALLAWIGEKFLDWTDTDPSLDTILESVSLYWLTDTFPKAIYTYREVPANHVTKPFGFSWFPYELIPTPKAWAETTGNLVLYKQHTEGGHFAALEKPEILFADIEEFVKIAWKVR
ncbi:alpha/beta-hydrolase [Saccharata proteae CBS 121410]|uniref:Alpha/beta-hydrolase n=1 Tax=Saccharata proteae CBS 121410 TaxID=1314787 RepID=A0A9P4I3K4_9PEZI|nr:alpha/beta-hydrolase [Saccharata proteae CBS 121410]